MQIIKRVKNRVALQKSNHAASGIYKVVRDYTMIDSTLFADNLALAAGIDQLPGDIVECGVWRGGMIAGFAFQSKVKRNYFLFDSFEGLPAPKEMDGQMAFDWVAGGNPSTFHNNCTAEIGFAKDIMAKTGKPHTIVKGWFENTIPDYHFPNEISLLRLDGDWYDSTIVCLKHLYQKVITGGLVVIDDYYTWDGCSRAVHDYLSSINSASRITRTKNGVAYIIKMD